MQRLALLAGLAMAADAAVLGAKTEARCGPQTKVCLASFTTAAGDPEWECTVATDGAKAVITAEQSKHGAKVCGPGSFHFSPMQCAGDRFDYKKATTEVDVNSVTTGCQPVSFPYTMSCYSVSC